ncbi:MAG TPA: 5-(carboxyamino)imidazole ribonucleotide synthase [Thermodesulfobacteriota bacterium]
MNTEDNENRTTVGIIGGGQLARMTAIAAYRLGLEIAILDPDIKSPAGQIVQKVVIGSINDIRKLEELSRISSLITLENEFVDAPLLEKIESSGTIVYPSSKALGLIQDKLTQKRTLEFSMIGVPKFLGVSGENDILEAGRKYGWPIILKVRRNAYDGRGNESVSGPDEIHIAWNNLHGGKRDLMVEEFIRFKKELAIMVVRNTKGETATYPVVETIQKDHICHIVRAPAGIGDDISKNAANMAEKAIEAIDGIGVFGIEMFLLEDDRVLINEIAPRPHNSGHYTIEACITSQYENHLRAILGYPLGSTSMVTPAAVMVNLLGSRHGESVIKGLEEALQITGAHIHIYCKQHTRPNRKMGHVTVLGQSIEESFDRALKAASMISF